MKDVGENIGYRTQLKPPMLGSGGWKRVAGEWGKEGLFPFGYLSV